MMNHIRRRNVCIWLLSGRGRCDRGHQQYESGAEETFVAGVTEFFEVQAGQLCDIKKYDKWECSRHETPRHDIPELMPRRCPEADRARLHLRRVRRRFQKLRHRPLCFNFFF